MTQAPTRFAYRFGLQDKRPECTMHNKIAFSSQADTQRSADNINKRDKYAHEGYVVQAYLGKGCDWWHVGHGRVKVHHVR